MGPLTPSAIHNLESQIVAEAKAQCEKALGDRKVTVYSDNPDYKSLSDRCQKLVDRYPLTAHGQRIIGSSCIVTPKLLVRFDSFEKLFQERVPGNMFVDEIGKIITFGPLLDPVLGYITRENVDLKVTNIRIIPDLASSTAESGIIEESSVEPSLPEQEFDERECILLNQDVTIGYVDTNPNISKTKIIADVTFGDLLDAKDQVIEVETQGDEATTYLTFTLPPLEGKITHTGTVCLVNKQRRIELTLEKLEALVESIPKLCIDRIFRPDAPFYPT